MARNLYILAFCLVISACGKNEEKQIRGMEITDKFVKTVHGEFLFSENTSNTPSEVKITQKRKIELVRTSAQQETQLKGSKWGYWELVMNKADGTAYDYMPRIYPTTDDIAKPVEGENLTLSYECREQVSGNIRKVLLLPKSSNGTNYDYDINDIVKKAPSARYAIDMYFPYDNDSDNEVELSGTELENVSDETQESVEGYISSYICNYTQNNNWEYDVRMGIDSFSSNHIQFSTEVNQTNSSGSKLQRPDMVDIQSQFWIKKNESVDVSTSVSGRFDGEYEATIEDEGKTKKILLKVDGIDWQVSSFSDNCNFNGEFSLTSSKMKGLPTSTGLYLSFDKKPKKQKYSIIDAEYCSIGQFLKSQKSSLGMSVATQLKGDDIGLLLTYGSGQSTEFLLKPGKK